MRPSEELSGCISFLTSSQKCGRAATSCGRRGLPPFAHRIPPRSRSIPPPDPSPFSMLRPIRGAVRGSQLSHSNSTATKRSRECSRAARAFATSRSCPHHWPPPRLCCLRTGAGCGGGVQSKRQRLSVWTCDGGLYLSDTLSNATAVLYIPPPWSVLCLGLYTLLMRTAP